MRHAVLTVAVALLGFFSGQFVGGNPAEDAKWDLLRDFQIDGKVDETEHATLQLKAKGNQLSGHFSDGKVSGKVNDSTFTGEIVAREKPLLILRQYSDSAGGYVVIHTGHLVGENHYRGTWHDNSGQSGDFELKAGK